VNARLRDSSPSVVSSTNRCPSTSGGWLPRPASSPARAAGARSPRRPPDRHPAVGGGAGRPSGWWSALLVAAVAWTSAGVAVGQGIDPGDPTSQGSPAPPPGTQPLPVPGPVAAPGATSQPTSGSESVPAPPPPASEPVTPPVAAGDERASSVVTALLPEPQRAFFEDGPGLLLSAAKRAELLALDDAARQTAIDALLADPEPATPENELQQAIERRRRLAAAYALSFADDRARLAFLRGAPESVEKLDCGMTFKTMELWRYPSRRAVVVYRPEPAGPYRVWRPLDSKRALYIPDMEYWLEQWEEYGRPTKRFDLQTCALTKQVDEATGVEGLADYRPNRPSQADIDGLLGPPADLAAWAKSVLAAEETLVPPGAVLLAEEPAAAAPGSGGGAAGPAAAPGAKDPAGGPAPGSADAPADAPAAGEAPAKPDGMLATAVAALKARVGGADPAAAAAAAAAAVPAPVVRRSAEPLSAGPLEVQFPERRGQRIVVRGLIRVPAEAGFEPFVEPESETSPEKRELRLAVDGVIEQAGKVFESFRVRYRLPPPSAGVPLELQLERALRPGMVTTMRLRLRDEISGRETLLARGFAVPAEPIPVAVPAVPEEAVVALAEEMAEQRIPGRDSLVLVPPAEDVVLGLWRAEALVTGERIARVLFKLDGKEQLARARPPFSAEIRLAQFPVEQTVRAEGYDKGGELVAADEVVLNQPRGALRVRILQPGRGHQVRDQAVATAEVVVPEGRRVELVEFRVNDVVAASLVRPPWEAAIEVPEGQELVYLTVTARLDDGAQAEDFRFLNNPQYLEEVDVDLVELYTTVMGSNNRPVTDLAREAFTVLEDGKLQTLAKFERVTDLPLNIGLVIDTSGSMTDSLAQAQLAAKAFLDGVMTPRDRGFVLSFADRPVMLMPPTEDLLLLQSSLDGLQAYGYTALHDAMMTGLYYFRGIRGRRALVLLSDGDDTSSASPFRDLLEYARRSGVTIYTIGLNVSGLDLAVRRKLDQLATETGGRVFYASNAGELRGVYEEIERELRSQYLLAYSSNSRKPAGQFRTIEVKVKGGLKGRTLGGYYP
jgi:Ca-activated chloride channel family protein